MTNALFLFLFVPAPQVEGEEDVDAGKGKRKKKAAYAGGLVLDPKVGKSGFSLMSFLSVCVSYVCAHIAITSPLSLYRFLRQVRAAA